MVFESNTLEFLWMQDGKQGAASGEGLYTWMKYSHHADGSDMSDDSTDMEYIGIAYNKTEKIESEDPADYKWSRIKGEDGEPGTDGYTIILENENISFAASSLKIPLNDQTASCKVTVFQGTEKRNNFLIGEIKSPVGISITVENKVIYLSVSSSTAIGSLSGAINVPIQVDGITFNKTITYSLSVKGEDGNSPVSVYLSNENHTFAATSNGNAIASKVQTNVYAFYGTTQVSATVGNLTPAPGIKIDIVNNGQNNTFLNISVDSTLIQNGILDIPVTVGKNVYHRTFSYTLSPQGADGSPAKAIDITPSSQVFKSTDGGSTFSPDTITLTPRFQGNIDYSKWQYSTDGGETWNDVVSSTNGVTVSTNILSVSKSSTLYTKDITSIVFKCMSTDSNFYDTCTISKIYDVVDFKDSVDAEFKETKEIIAGVEQKADKANKSISDKVWQDDITTTINNYDNSTIKDVRNKVTAVEKNLKGITSTVKDMQTTVEKKADGSTVTELTNHVSQVEQDVRGFKQTVENTYAKQSDLENVNKYAKTSFEQLSDKFSWIVESNSSQTSLTLTDSLISAVTKQFIIKDNNGSVTIIEGGKIKANAITTQMLSSDAIKSTNYKEGVYTNGAGYSKTGTFLDLKTGMIHMPSFYTNSNGDAYINGYVVANGGVIGGCSILDGKLTIPSANISGTLNASQIRIGDFTNYHDLTVDTYERYGFTLVSDVDSDGNIIEENNPWFQHTPKRDISICPVVYDTYKSNGGETFLIEFEMSSTVQATETIKYGKNAYVDVKVGLYAKKADGSNGWYCSPGHQSDESGSIQKVSATVTLDNNVRNFSTFIQCDGSGTFTGTLKIRNISVRRMTDNSLIVDGSITLDKISANNIEGNNGWINLKKGTFNYGNGKFTWDGENAKIGLWSILDDGIGIKSKYGVPSSGGNPSYYSTLFGKSKIKLTTNEFDRIDLGDAPEVFFEVNTKGVFCDGLFIGASKKDGVVTNGIYEQEYNPDGACKCKITSEGIMNICSIVVSEKLNIEATSTLEVNGTSTFLSDSTFTKNIYANAIYTNNKTTSIGENITTKGMLHVEGAAGFYGSVTARSTFSFLDYEAEENASASATFRRPVASASAGKNRVAYIQSNTGNKLSIRAKFGTSNWSTATFTGSSSDKRLKKNIKNTFVKALPTVMNIKMHRFDWKDTDLHQSLGCIADELEELDPMLVSGGGYESDGSMNIKSINTLLLTEYNSKAIQEQQEIINSQQNQIHLLEKKLKKLSDMLNNLGD